MIYIHVIFLVGLALQLSHLGFWIIACALLPTLAGGNALFIDLRQRGLALAQQMK